MASAAQKSTFLPSDPLLQVCKASADALRLDILRVLRTESFGVTELCRIFDMPQPGMSHHLKILATAGLLVTRREGNSIFYHRNANPTFESDFAIKLLETLDQSLPSKSIQSRTHKVQNERQRLATNFFHKNADKLKKNQDLIAEFSHYKANLSEFIDELDLPSKAQVLEIGAGESPLLNLLADSFDQIMAIDNTMAMLEKAENNLTNANKKKTTFVLGDIESVFSKPEESKINNLGLDLIVLNMVLHHMASPSQFFEQAEKYLANHGLLLIIDLCQHHQDWAREVCGDMWLGFEPNDLDLWAKNAGMNIDQSAYLGLKNGFQVQIRLFKKQP